MSRSFQIFIALLGFIVAVIGLGIWWIGYAVFDLGYLDDRSDEPMLVIDLPSSVYSATAQAGLTELLLREQAQIIGQYRRIHTLIGERSSEFETLFAARVLAGSDIVKVVTSSEYRAREADVLLGSFDEGRVVAAEQWRSGLVLILLEQRPSVDALLGMLGAVEGAGGRVVWDASTRMLTKPTASNPATRTPWNRLVILDFASPDDALVWVRRPEVVDQRAIANARANEMTLSVFTKDNAGDVEQLSQDSRT